MRLKPFSIFPQRVTRVRQFLMPEHKIFPSFPGPTSEPQIRIWDLVVLSYIVLFIIAYLTGLSFFGNWWFCALLYITGAISVMRWRVSADFHTPVGIFFFGSLVVAIFSMLIPVVIQLSPCEEEDF